MFHLIVNIVVIFVKNMFKVSVFVTYFKLSGVSQTSCTHSH